MYEDIKFLARRNYKRQSIGNRRNYMGLHINQANKRIALKFHSKPPTDIRKLIRVYNFKWSRKNKYWHSYMDKNKVKKIKKIYHFINN